VNTGTISNSVFWRNQNQPNMPMKRVIHRAGWNDDRILAIEKQQQV
jgi:hypothetical protein